MDSRPNLLGTGIVRREETIGRNRRIGIRYRVIVKELGDPEIEQFWHAIFRHQDILGLQVPMDHQIAMRILHCAAQTCANKARRSRTLSFRSLQ